MMGIIQDKERNKRAYGRRMTYGRRTLKCQQFLLVIKNPIIKSGSVIEIDTRLFPITYTGPFLLD